MTHKQNITGLRPRPYYEHLLAVTLCLSFAINQFIWPIVPLLASAPIENSYEYHVQELRAAGIIFNPDLTALQLSQYDLPLTDNQFWNECHAEIIHYVTQHPSAISSSSLGVVDTVPVVNNESVPSSVPSQESASAQSSVVNQESMPAEETESIPVSFLPAFVPTAHAEEVLEPTVQFTEPAVVEPEVLGEAVEDTSATSTPSSAAESISSSISVPAVLHSQSSSAAESIISSAPSVVHSVETSSSNGTVLPVADSSTPSLVAEPVLAVTNCLEFKKDTTSIIWRMPHAGTFIEIGVQAGVWPAPASSYIFLTPDLYDHWSYLETLLLEQKTVAERTAESLSIDPRADAIEQLLVAGVIFNENTIPVLVDEKGLPVTSEPVHSCVRNQVTFNADGTPYNCSRYHDGNRWQIDLNREFPLFATIQYKDYAGAWEVEVPDGYIVLTQELFDLWQTALDDQIDQDGLSDEESVDETELSQKLSQATLQLEQISINSIKLLQVDIPATAENLTEDGELQDKVALKEIIKAITTKKDIKEFTAKALVESDLTTIATVVADDAELVQRLQDNDIGVFGQTDKKQSLIDSVENAIETQDAVKAAIAKDVALHSDAIQELANSVEETIIDTIAEETSNDTRTIIASDIAIKKVQEAADIQMNPADIALELRKTELLASVDALEVGLEEELPNYTDLPPILTISLTPKQGGDTIVLTSEDYSFRIGSVVLVLEPKREFTPGLYELTVTVTNPITGNQETMTQDFAWGVLALNTDKDTYIPSETATIDIGVLDDEGEIVCDADVELIITNPLGTVSVLTTADASIVRTNTCGTMQPGFIEPDYTTHVSLQYIGEYIFELHANTPNGTRSLKRSVHVAESPAWQVQRTSATRLWPMAKAPMNIAVTFNQDYEGEMYDIVPSSFNVTGTVPSATLDTPTGKDFTTITWSGSFKAGDTYAMSYDYDAPDVSPQFYTVGPLQAASGALLEARSWQIANDAPTGAPTILTPVTPHSTGSTLVVFTGTGSTDTNEIRLYSGAVLLATGSVIGSGWSITADLLTDGVYTITATEYNGDESAASNAVVVTVNVQRPFITTWKTDNSGATGSNQIQIPTSGAGYNYNVDWGDGTYSTGLTGNHTHTFPTASTYTVQITGDFPRIYFNNTGDREKILTVEQWGDIEWTDMTRAFAGATNLDITATDAPDLSGVTTLNNMFFLASSLSTPVFSTWDTSSITDMSSMFFLATSFNADISNWNTSNVQTMASMFRFASSFDQDISSWNVAKVTDFSSAFQEASSFNQDISMWNTASGVTMNNMFNKASSFDQPIGAWNTTNLQFVNSMFSDAISFNQTLSGWNVSQLISATNMLKNVTLSVANYDDTLTNWNAQALNASVSFSGGQSKYCNAAIDRSNMIISDSWTIVDGGSACIPPTILNPATNTQTGTVTPTISGTGTTVGYTITLYSGSTVLGTGVVQSNKTWKITTSALNDSVYELHATEFGGGLTSAASNMINLITLTQPPTIITPISPHSTGSSVPTLSGTASLASAIIRLYSGATLIGTTVSTTNKTWQVTVDSLPDGVHNITAQTTSGSITTGASNSVLVTTVANAPTISTPAAVTSTSATIVPFTGTATIVGAEVRLYSGSTVVGTGTVQPNLTWSIVPDWFTIASYTIEATSVFNGIETPRSNAVDLTIEPAIFVSAVAGTTSEAGGTTTFTIVLNDQPTANVTIPLTSSDLTEGTVPASITITPANWNNSGANIVTVTGIDDALIDGTQSYTIETGDVTSADPDFDALNAGTTPDVPVNNTDNDTAGIIVSPISTSTTETGSTATFHITLTAEPIANVTIPLTSSDLTEGTVTGSITITPANWNNSGANTVTVTGVDDFIVDGTQSYTIVTGDPTSSDVDFNALNATDAADVPVNNTDNDTAGIIVSPISSSTTETGSTATFHITLTAEPTANVTIPLTSSDLTEGTVTGSITITPANWNNSGANTVTVTGVDDVIIDGTQNYTIVTGDPTSGDASFNALNATDAADVSVNTTDNDTAGILVSTISNSTSETGSTATFQITLTAQPTANVTIPLSSSDVTEGTATGSIIITPVNWNNSGANTVTVTGVDDVLIDGTQAYTIVTGDPTSSDVDFNALIATDALDVIVINTDNDTAGIIVSNISTSTTEAGGTATFQITLTAEPTANVTIPLTSSDVTEGTVTGSIIITPVNWNNSGANTVTVTGVDDVTIDGTIGYTIVTGDPTSSDVDFTALIATDAADVAVQNTDNDTAGIIVSPISANTTETGTTATFQITLTAEPTANVTIPLTSSDITEGTVTGAIIITPVNWNNSGANTVTVTGVDDLIVDGTQSYTIVTGDPTSGDVDFNALIATDAADVAVNNTDNDVAGIIVSPISGNTTETGSTATFQITLTAQPTANVTIPLTSSDITEGTVPANITITPVNWNNSGANTVTVTGIDDVIIDGTIGYTIVTGDPTSGDASFNTLIATDATDVSVNTTDNDTAGIIVSSISGNTTETGSTATFQITLTAQPTVNVTIPLSSSDVTEGTVTGAIIITPVNWNNSGANTVAVTGVDDVTIDGTQGYTIVTGDPTSGDVDFNALIATDAADVAVQNTDNDTAGIIVSPITNSTTETGATATFQITLTAQPTANVTIPLSSSDVTEGTVPANITITPVNWNNSGANTVTVTGVDDFIVDGTQNFTIVTGDPTSGDVDFNALIATDAADVAVQNTDNDQANVLVSTISTDTTEAGGTATFQISLTAEPTANVTIPLSSSDVTEGTVTGSIIITPVNWNNSGANTVTVTGVDDVIIDGTQAYTIQTGDVTSSDLEFDALTSGTTPDVSINNMDNDGPGIYIAAISTTTSETGAVATARVVLNSMPTANVIIPLSSSDVTEGTVTGAIIISPANWNNSGANIITITGIDDNVIDGTQNYTLITGDPISADPDYNALNDTDTTNISLSNTDNDTAGIIVSPISNSTSETGATATFQITLTAEPTANVTIPLSSSDVTEGTVTGSIVITPANWNNSGANTVTVTGVDDVIIDGTQGYTIVTGNPTSSDVDFNALISTDAADVPVNNTDNDTAGIIVSSISNSTSETGSTATFQITLTAEPTANVTIPLTSSDLTEGTVPASITITPANWNNSGANIVTVTGIDDALIDGTQSYTIETGDVTSADPDFDALNAGTTPDVPVNNTDNDTAGIIVSPISTSTTETGSTATFHITLTAEPTSNVTIPLSSSDLTEGTVTGAIIITPVNWNNSGVNTVTVTGVDDFIVDGTQSYTIVTGDPTSSDVDFNALNATDAADVPVNNTDNDTAGIIVSPISANTTETGSTATFHITLTAEPTANVTIPLTSSDLTEGTVTGSITITPANWNNSGANTVTVTGVDDVIIDGTQNYTIVTGDPASGDASFNTLIATDAADVSVNTTDNDTAGILVSTISTDTTETGGTATFQITLTAEPTANVTIPLSSSDVTEGTATGSIIITPANWNNSGANTVTVTGVDDVIIDGSQAYTIVTGDPTSSDVDFNALIATDALDVIVINTDNDTAGIIVGNISTSTTEAGGTATFQITLTAQPTANVTIPLTSSDVTEGTVTGSIIITPVNWNNSGANTVTVTGVDDGVIDSTQSYTIITGDVVSVDPDFSVFAAGMIADVSVNNLDDDGPGVFMTAISTITTETGAIATVQVTLNSMPTADVTIPLTSSDTTEGTVTGSIVITPANWNNGLANIITITGIDDIIVDGNQGYVLETGDPFSADGDYNGLTSTDTPDIILSNTDNDTAGIIVSPISGNTTETDSTATFQITLTAEPTANVTIPLTSSDITEGTVPANITITPANWNNSGANTVTVTGVDDVIIDGTQNYTIVTGDPTSGDASFNALISTDAADVPVNNTDNDTAGIIISSISNSTSETGVTATFQITLTAEPNANVTIPLSSSDVTEGTVTGSIIITPVNWNNSGANTVTVTGVDDVTIDGTQGYTIVTGDPASSDVDFNALNATDAADVAVQNTDNDTAGIIVSSISNSTSETGSTATFQITLTAEPTANVTIPLTSSDATEGTVPANITITPVNWNNSGANTVTVTGVDDLIVDGTQNFTIITGDPTSGDVDFNVLTAGATQDVTVQNTDNDTAGIIVSPISNSTSETGSIATFQITLTAEPTANVTIPLTSSDLTEGAVPASITIAPADWNNSGANIVTVTGLDDFMVDGTQGYTIITGDPTSGDASFNALIATDVADVVVNNTDDDVPGIIVGSVVGNTTETGATASFQITLTSQPSANVTIPLLSSNVTEGTVPANITITPANWNNSGANTVTITGVEDFIFDGNQTYTITTGDAISADVDYALFTGGLIPDRTVLNVDTSSAAVVVTYTGATTTEAGASTTIKYSLTSIPASDVTIALASSDVTEGILSGTVLITPVNWNTGAFVTVIGVDDALVDGTQSYTVLATDVVSTDPNFDALTGTAVTVVTLYNTDDDLTSLVAPQETGGGAKRGYKAKNDASVKAYAPALSGAEFVSPEKLKQAANVQLELEVLNEFTPACTLPVTRSWQFLSPSSLPADESGRLRYNNTSVYPDVKIKSDWFGPYVHRAVLYNVLDATQPALRPHDELTMGEFAAILARSAQLQIPESDSQNEHWSIPYIAALQAKNVPLFTSTNIDWAAPVNRLQAINAIITLFGITADDSVFNASSVYYSDVDSTNAPVQTAIALATKLAIVQGYTSITGAPLGIIGLEDSLTRAQALKMVSTAAHVCY